MLQFLNLSVQALPAALWPGLTGLSAAAITLLLRILVVSPSDDDDEEEDDSGSEQF